MKNLSCDYDDAESLYEAYMPFIKQSAVFVKTHESFVLGDELLLDLHLMKEPDRLEIQVRVVWITPVGAQGGLSAGVGVQFIGDNAKTLRHKIETYLAGMLNSPKQTETL